MNQKSVKACLDFIKPFNWFCLVFSMINWRSLQNTDTSKINTNARFF